MTKYVVILSIICLILGCKNAPPQKKPDEPFVGIDSLERIDSVDYSKKAVFIDTIFDDKSQLNISGYWSKNTNSALNNYFIDTVSVTVTNNNKKNVLVYPEMYVMDAVIKRMERIKDKEGNIMCFVEVYTATTPNSSSFIAFLQNKQGVKQVSFNGELSLPVIDCEVTTLETNKIVKSCWMRKAAGRETDEDLVYTRKTGTNFKLTNTIKR